MSTYSNSPFNNVKALSQLKPGYCFGSFDSLSANTRLATTASAVAANVCTLYGTIVEGNLPAVGSLVWVINATGDPGIDVSGVAITSETFVASTGAGNVTYPAIASNYAKKTDQGTAIIRVPEVAENLVVGKSRQFAVPPQSSSNTNTGREVTWSYTCPDAPGSIAIQLEGAINDVDAEYAIIGTSQTTATGATVPVTVPNAYRFLRLNVTATTTGAGSPPSGTIIAKILI